MRPTIMLTTISTPKCTRSTPTALTAGSSMGTNTSSMTAVSRKQPRTRNTTLTISKKATWLSDWPATHCASACGTPSAVKA
ncbi:hypothetical protein D3C72_2482600 [compost metagenome]